MDHERYQRWLRASNALVQVEAAFVFTVQALGKLDAQLFERDKRYLQIRANNDGTDAEWSEINESIALAHLWVLGSYEVVRTLDQRFRSGGVPYKRLHTFSRAAKAEFERVRIPLAKLEVPNSKKSPGR